MGTLLRPCQPKPLHVASGERREHGNRRGHRRGVRRSRRGEPASGQRCLQPVARCFTPISVGIGVGHALLVRPSVLVGLDLGDQRRMVLAEPFKPGAQICTVADVIVGDSSHLLIDNDRLFLEISGLQRPGEPGRVPKPNGGNTSCGETGESP